MSGNCNPRRWLTPTSIGRFLFYPFVFLKIMPVTLVTTKASQLATDRYSKEEGMELTFLSICRQCCRASFPHKILKVETRWPQPSTWLVSTAVDGSPAYFFPSIHGVSIIHDFLLNWTRFRWSCRAIWAESRTGCPMWVAERMQQEGREPHCHRLGRWPGAQGV